MWPSRTRLALFVGLCAASAGGVAVYIAWRDGGAPSNRPSVAAPSTPEIDAALNRIQAAPHVYVRSARAGELGRVVAASLADPDGVRVVSPVSCDRVAFGRQLGLCLVDTRTQVSPPAELRVLDRAFGVTRVVPLAGLPSRARVSADGRHGATTVFVSGESYAGVAFATRTHVYELPGGAPLPDLEQFTTTRDGAPFKGADFNFWGVTFLPDSRRFLATLATGGRIHLVEGDVPTRTMRVIGEDVECPSLSPGGTRVAFKRRRAAGNGWGLHVLDRLTGRTWPVAEMRSVDDQAEWLDEDHVLYGYVEERGLPEDAVNVWIASAIEGDATPPRIFLRGASSPSVVRP